MCIYVNEIEIIIFSIIFCLFTRNKYSDKNEQGVLLGRSSITYGVKFYIFKSEI